MDFFQRIGNLLTGGGFTNNKERKDDEERKRREAAAKAAQSKPNKSTSSNTSTTPRKTVGEVGLQTQEKEDTGLTSRALQVNPLTQQNQAPKLQARELVKQPAKPQLSDQDKQMIQDYNNPVDAGAFKRSREILDSILKDPNHRDYQNAKRLEPYITRNQTQAIMNKTVNDTAKFAGDLAKTPVDVAQAVPKAVIRTANQVTGNKETDLGDFWGKALGAENNKVGDFSSYGKETRTGVSGMFGDTSQNDSFWDPVIGAGLSALDVTPLAGIAAGTRVGLQQGVRQGINRATGARNIFTQSDAGGVPEAEVAAAARRQAEQALQELPDVVEVAPGIKSPNAAQDARARATAELEAARQNEAQVLARIQAEREAAQAELIAQQNSAFIPQERGMNHPFEVTPGPIGEQFPVTPVVTPQVARAIEPEVIAQADEAAQQIDEAAQAPVATAEVPTAQVVETPIEQASKEAPTVTTPVKEAAPAPEKSSAPSEDAIFADKRVVAAQERLEYLKRNGEPTQDAEMELELAKNDAALARSEAPKPKAKTVAHPVETTVETPVTPVKPKTVKATEAEAEVATVENKKPATAGIELPEKVKTIPPESKEAAPAKPATGFKNGSKTNEERQFVAGKDGTVEASTAEKPVMTKTGKVSKSWVNKETKSIMDSDTPAEQKAARMAELRARVDAAEGKAATKKQVEKDQDNPDLTKVEKRARARTAPVEAVQKAKGREKTKKLVSEEIELPRKAKGKVGGATSAHMSRVSALRGDPNAKAAAAGVASKKSVSYDKAMAKAATRVAEESVDTAIASAKNLDFNDLSFEKVVDAMAYNARMGDEIARLSRKKTLSKKETKQLENAREAQMNLIENVSMRESDNARSVGLLSHLYRSMDPDMVTHRVKKRIENAGGRITQTQEKQLLSRSKTLKQEFDRNSAVRDEFEQLSKSLNRSSSPEDFARFTQLSKQLADSDRKLGVAFDRVNVFTDSIKQENIQKGHITEEQWHGRRLDTYTRAAMLSAPSGRLRDLATTNILTQSDIKAADLIEAVLGKGVNLMTGKRTVDSKAFGKASVWAEGMKEGVSDIKAALQGKRETPKFLTGLAGSGKTSGTSFDERSGLYTGYSGSAKKPSKVLNYVHATVAAPTYLSKGYRNNLLYKKLYDTSLKSGLDKKQADQYARAMMVNPPKEIVDKVEYKVKEISGLQAETGRKLNNFFQGIEKKINKSDMSTAQKRAVANTFTVAKNLTIPFSSYMMGTTKNLLTRQNIAYNTYQFGKAALQKDPQKAIEALSQGTWNVAKITGAAYALSPFISDEDANGNTYNPPYLKINDETTIPIGSLGPAGGQIINLWATKRAVENMKNGTPYPLAVAGYVGDLARGVANAAGLANLNATSTPLTNAFNELTNPFFNNDPSKSAEKIESLGADLIADFATQMLPAVLRDINTLIPDSVKAETRVTDEDGKKLPWESALARVGSGVPFISQMLADDDEGAKAPNFFERVFGSTGMSQQQKDERAKTEAELSKLNNSISSVLGNEKYRSLLDEDQQKIYDEAGSKELTPKKLEEVRNALIKTSKKFVDEGDWDAYSKVKRLERDKMTADPKTPKSEVEKLDREITRSDLAKENKVEARIYKLYSEISNGELNDMLDPDDDEYDIETAKKLIALDMLYTDKKVSRNTDGQESWTRNKYEVSKGKGKGKGGGRGGSGSSKGNVTTDVGMFNVSNLKTVETPSLKARALKTYDSPIPNLASQTARTDLKKKITVQKGVKL